MDNETVKKLIVEKIFNVYAPKIIGYYRIMNNDIVGVWNANLWLLKENQRESLDKHEYHLSISMDENENFVECFFTKQQRPELDYAQHFRRRAVEVVPPIPVLELRLKNKKSAILQISENIDIRYAIQIGMIAITEIENYENVDNFGIGSIKKILDISPDVDLTNLETRKILTEFIK